MILRARVVVTMDGPPLENGAVVVNGESIVDLGSFADMRAKYPGEVLDLGERVLLPGLINAHCHLDYTGLRGKIPPQKSFTDWIRAINAERAKLSQQDYLDAIGAGFAESRRFGTTSMVNLTGLPELVPLACPTVRTWWAAELIDVRAPDKAETLVNDALRQMQAVARRALAPHAPYTASPELYRFCQKETLLLTTHLAESCEEMLMFRDGVGELFDFIRSINPKFDGGGRTPLAYFLTELDRGSPWLIAHLNELEESDFAMLRERRPSLGIVHCPRSHRFFRHSPFSFERLRDLGFPICLGTDSLASNDDLNLFAEMRAFQSTFPAVGPEDILAMVTRNPSLARVGRLRPSAQADIIAITSGGPFESIFEEIVSATEEPWVMIDGIAGTL